MSLHRHLEFIYRESGNNLLEIKKSLKDFS